MPRRPAKQPSEKNSRAARSGIQGGLVSAVILLINLVINPDLTSEQTLMISPFVLLVVSYFQNALEEAGKVPPILKSAPAAPVTTLTPEQMLATAEYLKAKALRESAEPRVFTVQETSPPRAGTAPPMPHVDIPPGGGRG